MTRRDDEQDHKSEPSFKFVDRRRFDETGESRDNVQLQATPEIKMGSTPIDIVEEALTQEADSAAGNEDPASGPVTFSLFLQSLAQQTLMAMGIIPWPDTGDVKVNLDHARETIDILTILHEKTKGNLTASEQRFFDSVLYELRVTFVQLVEHGTL